MESLRDLSDYEICQINGGYWPNPYSFLPGYKTVVTVKEFWSGMMDGVKQGYDMAPKY